MRFRVSMICCGSRPMVGSSRISTGGVPMSACAMPDALLVSLGEVLDQPPAHVGDLQHLHGPLHALLAARAGHALDVADEREVVADGHVQVQRRQLGHVPDLLLHRLRLLQDVVPVQLHRALRGGEVAGDDVHRRGLPRAVGPEEPEDLAPVHGEVQAVDGQALAVFLRDVLDLYQGILLSLKDAVRRFHGFPVEPQYSKISPTGTHPGHSGDITPVVPATLRVVAPGAITR